jgi:peroxiredoxin
MNNYSAEQIQKSRSSRRAGLLPPGEAAPGFSLRCAPHCRGSLEDLRGRPGILAFYVADWHPVCCSQLALYEELLSEFQRFGAGLIGISADSIWSHAAFARAYGLHFPLLSDQSPRGAVARAYGVYNWRTGTSRRALFVLDGDGIVRWSATYPDAVNPGADGILSALEKLVHSVEAAAPCPPNPEEKSMHERIER